MRKNNFQKLSDHYLLALTQFLTIFTEFSSILHLLPLSAIIYIPLFVSTLKKNQWANFACPWCATGTRLLSCVEPVPLALWYFQTSHHILLRISRIIQRFIDRSHLHERVSLDSFTPLNRLDFAKSLGFIPVYLNISSFYTFIR